MCQSVILACIGLDDDVAIVAVGIDAVVEVHGESILPERHLPVFGCLSGTLAAKEVLGYVLCVLP